MHARHRAPAQSSRPRTRRRRASLEALRAACSLTLALALAVTPLRTAWAGAVEGPAPAAASATGGALEQGDLTTAREQATAAREAAPTPENWRREAETCEQLQDYACALAAWRGHLEALPEDAGASRRAAEQRVEALEEESRGAVASEPPSSHRERLDQDRADRVAAANPPPPRPAPKPEPERLADVQIHKKWYFWVTIVAFAASAAAITGIAVKAALDEQPDDLDTANASARGPLPSAPPGLGFRF